MKTWSHLFKTPIVTKLFFYKSLTPCLGVLYALIFGQVTNIIQQFQKTSNDFNETLQRIKNFNKIYKVPSRIANRIEEYYTNTHGTTKGIEVEDVRITIYHFIRQKFIRIWLNWWFYEFVAFGFLRQQCLNRVGILWSQFIAN